MNILKFWRREERVVAMTPQLMGALEAAAEDGPFGMAALKVSGIIACARFLCESIAQLPLKLYQRGASAEERTEAREHPLYDMVSSRANQDMTSFEWRETGMLDAIVYGDWFNQIVMDGKRTVRELIPLSAGKDRMEVARDSAGKREYIYQKDDGKRRTFPADQILHVPVMTRGLRGQSLVEMAGNAVGLAISAEMFATQFFKEGADLRYLYELPANVSSEKVKEIAAWLKENYGGVKRMHRFFVAPGGAKVTAFQSEAEKLQLTQTREFQLEEIARVMRVPQHVVGLLRRATNNNIEHQGIEAVVYCLAPWGGRIEQRLDMCLLGDRERARFYFEFDFDGLLRGDYVSRVEGMSKEIASGLATPDEMRRRLNRPPVPGGDRAYIQGAMVPLNMAGVKPKDPQGGGQQ